MHAVQTINRGSDVGARTGGRGGHDGLRSWHAAGAFGGSDLLYGSAYNDSLVGGAGLDNMQANAGFDKCQVAPGDGDIAINCEDLVAS